ncbi:MAG: hypothetical protein LBQ05_01395 [Christensenellaceae bacterium]|jgi:hypothetical protein|nr:hypothetical protein [Christensenellaceae bacterium]
MSYSYEDSIFDDPDGKGAYGGSGPAVGYSNPYGDDEDVFANDAGDAESGNEEYGGGYGFGGNDKEDEDEDSDGYEEDDDDDEDDEDDDEDDDEEDEDFDGGDEYDEADGISAYATRLRTSVSGGMKGISKIGNAKGKLGKGVAIAANAGAVIGGAKAVAGAAKQAADTVANTFRDPFGSLRKHFANPDNPPNARIFKVLWGILLGFPPTHSLCVKTNQYLGRFINNTVDPETFFIPTIAVWCRWVISGRTETYKDYVGTCLATANFLLEMFFQTPVGKAVWKLYCKIVDKVLPKGKNK